MTNPSGVNNSIASRQSVSPSNSGPSLKVFPKERLEEIAFVFGISLEKINGISIYALQNKCFKKVLRACESDNWEKINEHRKLLFGITDLEGNTIFDVLTNLKDAPPNYNIDSPENLIFQGGGPKAIAYVGVLEVLEERKMLDFVKRVGGTSAGAITATLVAFGCGSVTMREFTNKKLLWSFLDFASSRAGVFKGDEFLKWINEIIESKTGKANFTFGQLRAAIREGKSFKHLHIFAYKAGNNKETVHFSSEDKQCDDLLIADAVRASMSLPFIFQPYTLRYQGENEQDPTNSKDAISFMDGGILWNFPLEAFDKKRYMTKCFSKQEGECQVTNKRTLAFSLREPGEMIPKKDTPITCFLSAIAEAKLTSISSAEDIYRKAKPYDK